MRFRANSGARRVVGGFVAAITAGSGLVLVGATPALAIPTCIDGLTPAVQSTVACMAAGSYTLTVPSGTTSVNVDLVGGGGGAGYPARQHIGGNAAEVTGTLALPAGTVYLYVIVGSGGIGDNHGTSGGGGGSAVFALNSGHALLAKLSVAGGGGGGAYNGDGGNAGAAGTSDNAQAVSGPGQPGAGATGGAGGTGTFSAGSAGGSNNPGALATAMGGTGGLLPNGAHGGGGGGGYAGGGGGGGSTVGILSTNVAGGGGGSSLASAYLDAAAIALKPGTGGFQLPGLVASDGATGSVTMTFNGAAVPGAPTAVSATPGDGQATVSFTPPASDGGAPITSYTVTAGNGGPSATCPGSPCVVPGLTNGTAYTFTVHATNENGDSSESAASSSVTPAVIPSAPTGLTATPGNGQASVAFTPGSDGGSAITSYTVTSRPGGKTATCSGSPCVVTGLDNGTAYTFTATATNAIGTSTASSPSTGVTPVTYSVAPTDVSATAGDGQAEVSFTAPTDNGGSPISAYKVTAYPGGTTVTCAGSPCTVTGLDNGTSYTFKVLAMNGVGESALSAPSSAVTPASVPDAPSEVEAVAGDGSAEVSFGAPADNGGSAITSYTVTSSPGGKTATCFGSPCTVTGLDNGTAYTFTATATNAIGTSTASSPSTDVTPAGNPAAVPAPTLTPGNGSIGLSFAVPASGGTAITGYEATTDGGLTWAPLSAHEADGTVTGTITGLANGQSYDVQVRALNAHGTGAASPVQSVTPVTVPAAPTGVSAARSDSGASVSFTPAGNGGSEVTGYTVTSSPGGITGTCSASPCVVSGLQNGTSYTFTVHATNAQGDSAESTASSAVTPAAAPGAPGSVNVVAGDGKATVGFAPAASNGAAVTGYEYSLDNGITWATLPAVPAQGGRLSGSITGLTNDTAYSVTVRAVNEVGPSAASSPQSVTPTAVVLTVIQTKYAALGGSSSFLGAPVGGEYAVAGGLGQDYRGGKIYWSQATGAWSVRGAIAAKYSAMGGPAGLLGFPTSDESAAGDGIGRYSDFAGAQGAAIYWSPATGAWSVHGSILVKYRALNGPRGLLAYPTSDEKASPAFGRVSTFSGVGGASVYWSPSTGAHVVYGAIRAKYLALGGPAFLGFPTTDEASTATKTGRYNHFSGANGASIFWSSRTGARSVHGAIRAQWIALGAERGRLGYPTSDEFAAGKARRSTFVGGTVTWNGRTTVSYTGR